MKTTYRTGVSASVTSSPDGEPLHISFNPDEFADLDGLFKTSVSDRLEAGAVRHNAIPSAAETAKTIAFHEFGHIVFNQSRLKDKDIRLVRTYHRAIENGDIDSISEYAKHSKNGSEFFAEVFAMWKNGEYLPDYIITLIKEVVL